MQFVVKKKNVSFYTEDMLTCHTQEKQKGS